MEHGENLLSRFRHWEPILSECMVCHAGAMHRPHPDLCAGPEMPGGTAYSINPSLPESVGSAYSHALSCRLRLCLFSVACTIWGLHLHLHVSPNSSRSVHVLMPPQLGVLLNYDKMDNLKKGDNL